MTKIKHLKDDEGKFYPYTHIDAVVGDDGEKVFEKVTALDHKVSDKQDKLIAGEGITIEEDGKTISAQGGGGGTDTWTVVEDITLSEAVASYIFNARPLKSVRIIFSGGSSDTSNVFLVINTMTDGLKPLFDGTLSGMYLQRYAFIDLINVGGYYRSAYCMSAIMDPVAAVQMIETGELKEGNNVTSIKISLRNMELPVGAKIKIYGVYA